jgi:MFS family permease
MPTGGNTVNPRGGTRRARLMVSGAAVAAVATAVLIALLVAGLIARTGPGPALGRGIAAFGTAAVAVGLLVLARAGALARDRSGRAGALYRRCVIGALGGMLAALLAGVIAAVLLRSAAPAWGGAVAGFLLALLVAVALRLRATMPPDDRRRRPGGGGASEPDRAADAR